MKEPTPCAISVVGSFSDLSSRPGGTGLREFPATGSPLDGSLENRRRTPPIEGGSAGHNAPPLRCGWSAPHRGQDTDGQYVDGGSGVVGHEDGVGQLMGCQGSPPAPGRWGTLACQIPWPTDRVVPL